LGIGFRSSHTAAERANANQIPARFRDTVPRLITFKKARTDEAFYALKVDGSKIEQLERRTIGETERRMRQTE